MDITNNKERFLGLCSQVKREGMDKLLEWLQATDFFEAPASTRFHGAYKGGLLRHSLNVYDEFVRLLAAYPEVKAPGESIIIAALFHDLCKASFYKTEQRNRKNAFGSWESYDFYTIDEKFCFGGHGSKSLFLLQQFIKVTPEEAVAINCHMSCWDGNKDVSNAFEQHPFAWVLHIADEAATFIKESKHKLEQ